MDILTIVPTYACPFKCNFCYNRNKCDDNSIIDLEKLDSFLEKYSKKFDKIIISGGEPSLIPTNKLNEIYNVVLKYSNLNIKTFSISTQNIHPLANYDISYDFIARPRYKESWANMLEFPNKFDVSITMSPMVFKFYPNKVLQMLNTLPNIKHLTFRPFFKTEFVRSNIRAEEYKKFINAVEQCKFNLKYTISFDDLFYGKQINEYVLNPLGDINIVRFNNEMRTEVKINPKEIGKCETNYPENILICQN